MRVVLNEDEWDVQEELSLGEILAQVSNKAHAKRHLVTSLTVGGRPLTDRDLQPVFLAQQAKNAGPVKASSRPLAAILQEAQPSMREFGAQLKADAEPLVAMLRVGMGGFASLDSWLGRLADYVEMTETARAHALPDMPADSLIPWIQEVVDARAAADSVRLADLLEYELLPRLAPKTRKT